VQGAGLQMGYRPSKAGNDAMSMYTLSETDSDYIRQANHNTDSGAFQFDFYIFC